MSVAYLFVCLSVSVCFCACHSKIIDSLNFEILSLNSEISRLQTTIKSFNEVKYRLEQSLSQKSRDLTVFEAEVTRLRREVLSAAYNTNQGTVCA